MNNKLEQIKSDDISQMIANINYCYTEGLKQGANQARSIDSMSLDKILGFMFGKFDMNEISEAFQALGLEVNLKCEKEN